MYGVVGVSVCVGGSVSGVSVVGGSGYMSVCSCNMSNQVCGGDMCRGNLLSDPGKNPGILTEFVNPDNRT